MNRLSRSLMHICKTFFFSHLRGLVGFLFFVLTISSLESFSQTTSSNTLENILKEWQQDAVFSSASWSVKAVCLSDAKVVAEYNSNAALAPASVMKVVTIGSGFVLKGSDFNFETLLQYSGNIVDSILNGDLIIYGKGDPTLCSPRFDVQKTEVVFAEWMTEIQKAGIKKINGNLIADASFFNGESIPNGWTWGDIGNYFGAGVYGLNFHDNEYTVTFAAGKTVGDKAVIEKIDPQPTDVEFVNLATIGNANSGDQIMIYAAPESNTCRITGTIPLSGQLFSVRGAIPNPPKTLAVSFFNYLKAKGIEITGMSQSSPQQHYNPTVFYVHHPVNYAQTAFLANTKSINMYTEAILCSLGKNRSGKSSISNGIDAVSDFLEQQKISTKGFRMIDGSGLSRSNLVSSRFMCDFLAMMYKTPSFQSFYDTFSVAGVSGTLSNMCKGTCAEKNLRAKSGSMNGVRAYAGYVKNKAGAIICFSILINNFECKQSVLTPKIEKLMTALAE